MHSTNILTSVASWLAVDSLVNSRRWKARILRVVRLSRWTSVFLIDLYSHACNSQKKVSSQVPAIQTGAYSRILIIGGDYAITLCGLLSAVGIPVFHIDKYSACLRHVWVRKVYYDNHTCSRLLVKLFVCVSLYSVSISRINFVRVPEGRISAVRIDSI